MEAATTVLDQIVRITYLPFRDFPVSQERAAYINYIEKPCYRTGVFLCLLKVYLAGYMHKCDVGL